MRYFVISSRVVAVWYFWYEALDEFQKVKQNFPEGNKVFDAEIKTVYTYHKLNSIEQARQKLSQLSRDWPHQKYAAQIRILREEIPSDGSE